MYEGNRLTRAQHLEVLAVARSQPEGEPPQQWFSWDYKEHAELYTEFRKRWAAHPDGSHGPTEGHLAMERMLVQSGYLTPRPSTPIEMPTPDSPSKDTRPISPFRKGLRLLLEFLTISFSKKRINSDVVSKPGLSRRRLLRKRRSPSETPRSPDSSSKGFWKSIIPRRISRKKRASLPGGGRREQDRPLESTIPEIDATDSLRRSPPNEIQDDDESSSDTSSYYSIGCCSCPPASNIYQSFNVSTLIRSVSFT
ncbi:hypothetical protein NLI96_g8653 [Meripilus lineatus]|uniref:Uncharacterized protein n=1 Tax=Meripilus lineatus TaxID=2056292 RepID=A0AAD5V1K1_9APHY|nr:hypothetical protein NLI96_g8653 [Physisporinus lineatus]